jgi:hypothetical protein
VRRTAVEIRLFGAFHDRVHVLRYAGVRRYEFAVPAVAAGHGDLFAYEVRLARDGVSIEHEMLFVGRADPAGSRMLIECADFTHETIVPSRRITGRCSGRMPRSLRSLVRPPLNGCIVGRTCRWTAGSFVWCLLQDATAASQLGDSSLMREGILWLVRAFQARAARSNRMSTDASTSPRSPAHSGGRSRSSSGRKDSPI